MLQLTEIDIMGLKSVNGNTSNLIPGIQIINR